MTRPMDCDRFDLLLPDWLDDALSPDESARVDEHRAACERCESLTAGIAAITTAARALPERMPDRDLWDGVASRIGSPVIAIQTGEFAAAGRGSAGTTVTPIGRNAPRAWHPWPSALAAAAAVALVAIGAASLATRTGDPTLVAGADAPVPTPVAVMPATPVVAAPDSTAPSSASGAETAWTPDTPAPATRTPIGSPRGAAVLAAAPARTPAEIVAQSYARDIALLVTMMEQQRTALDTSTVAVLERNFQIIDQAIEESRLALERDPASRALTQQFDAALATKLELLRRVVLLTSGS